MPPREGGRSVAPVSDGDQELLELSPVEEHDRTMAAVVRNAGSPLSGDPPPSRRA